MTASTASTSDTADHRVRRRVRLLWIDVLVSAPAAVVFLAGAAWLDGVLGMPAWGLTALGAFFLVYSVTLVVFARGGAPRPAMLAVAAGNAGWGVLSVVVVLADALTLTTAGTVVALAQAAFVIVIAVPQYLSAAG